MAPRFVARTASGVRCRASARRTTRVGTIGTRSSAAPCCAASRTRYGPTCPRLARCMSASWWLHVVRWVVAWARGYWAISKRLRRDGEQRGCGSTASPRTNRWRVTTSSAATTRAAACAAGMLLCCATTSRLATRTGRGGGIARRRRFHALATRSSGDTAVRGPARTGVVDSQAARTRRRQRQRAWRNGRTRRDAVAVRAA